MRLLGILLVTSAALAQDRDEALAQIRDAEANLRNAQFTMESRVNQRSSAGELAPSDQFSNVEGLIAPGSRTKYRVKIHASVPAVVKHEGNMLFTSKAIRRVIGFDGTTQTAIEYAPDSFDSPGRVRVNNPTSWQGERGFLAIFSNRLTYVLPLYEGMGLSAYLATIPHEAPDWKVVPSDSPDLLTIWFPHARFTPDGLQDQMSYLVTLDLARGGNIVDWKWYLDYGSEQPQPMAALEDVQLKEIEGHWLPVSFVRREYSYDPKSGENVVRNETRTKLTWSHINAELGPDAFHVEYPSLRSVTDSPSDSAEPLSSDTKYWVLDLCVLPKDWTPSQKGEVSEAIAEYEQASHTVMGKNRYCCRFEIPSRVWEQVIEGARAEGATVDTIAEEKSEEFDEFFNRQESRWEDDKGNPLVLDWWNPESADALQRIAWYEHRPQTPKKWGMAQVSRNNDENLLIYVYATSE